jgi:hypothetical protein
MYFRETALIWLCRGTGGGRALVNAVIKAGYEDHRAAVTEFSLLGYNSM